MAYLRLEYVSKFNKRLSGSSLDNAWKALRSFFKWANQELDLARPDLDLERPKFTSEPIQPFTHEEVKKILESCSYTKEYDTSKRKSFHTMRPSALRDRAIVLILLDTGMRVGELCRLKIEDVNLENGEVLIKPYGSGQKTKSRHVYLGKVSRSALWKYLSKRETSPGDPVFSPGDTHHAMDRNSLRRMLEYIGERVGIQNVHPHRFRHTFAIEYLRNGGDVFTLQRLLGHSSLTMSARYLQISQVDLAATHKKASPTDRWF